MKTHRQGCEEESVRIGQQQGFPLRKYFISGCVGRGLDLDLRVCPLSPLTSVNLGFFPVGIEVEQQDFRTAWDITGQKFQGVGHRFLVLGSLLMVLLFVANGVAICC